MFKKILMSTLAVGALALGAPAAQADEPTFDCNFNTVQQEASTGQSFEGAAYGYVVHAGDAGATIRCYIAVNGAEVSSTPVGTGVTAGRLTYSAGETDVVTFHAEYCTSHGCATEDYETVRTQIPPQEVWDLLISIAETIDATLAPVYDALTGIEKDVIDPLVCPVLATLEGDYAGVVTINSQGDIFLAGEAFWDCPPYDLFG